MPQVAIERVNEYLCRFGEAVGADLQPLDADGHTNVRHGSIVIGINVIVERNVMLILVRMGSLAGLTSSSTDSAQLYRRLLELNFLATRMCCFAIDERRERLYLRAMRPLDNLEYEEFADLLETVAAVAEAMRAKVPELTD